MRSADDSGGFLPRLPKLRLDQRMQLMSRSRGDTIPDLEDQFSRQSRGSGDENGTLDAEIAPERNDDELWSEWTRVSEQLIRPRWRTDGFSSLPFLRR